MGQNVPSGALIATVNILSQSRDIPTDNRDTQTLGSVNR